MPVVASWAMVQCYIYKTIASVNEWCVTGQQRRPFGGSGTSVGRFSASGDCEESRPLVYMDSVGCTLAAPVLYSASFAFVVSGQ